MTYSKIKNDDLTFLYTYRNHYYHYYMHILKLRLRLGESVEVVNVETFHSGEIERFEHYLMENIEKRKVNN